MKIWLGNLLSLWDSLSIRDLYRRHSDGSLYLKKSLRIERFKSEFMQAFATSIEYGISEPQVEDWDSFNKAFLTAVQKALRVRQELKRHLMKHRKKFQSNEIKAKNRIMKSAQPYILLLPLFIIIQLCCSDTRYIELYQGLFIRLPL